MLGRDAAVCRAIGHLDANGRTAYERWMHGSEAGQLTPPGRAAEIRPRRFVAIESRKSDARCRSTLKRFNCDCLESPHGGAECTTPIVGEEHDVASEPPDLIESLQKRLEF